MKNRKILLVYNNSAGKIAGDGKLEEILKETGEIFRKHCLSFDFANFSELNSLVCKESYDTIVAVGGDGTVLYVLPHIVNKDIKLGIIPCGTANLLAEKLGIPKDIKKAAEIIIKGEKKLIDAGKINDSYFALRVGFGMDAQIVNGANALLKNKFGYLAYLFQGIKCVFNLSPKSVEVFEISTKNLCFKIDASAVIVSNSGNMFGKRFSIAPQSDFSDGMLDLFILKAENIFDFMKVFLQILFNRHKPSSSVIYAKTDKIMIKSLSSLSKSFSPAFSSLHVDGEERVSSVSEISLIRNGLCVLAPSSVGS